ncbi:hypothetical protein SLE2022_326820 [Rubroshorea leprosula]
MRVTYVHRKLIHSLEPGPAQFPCESEVPKEHISHSPPFTFRQPHRHQSIRRFKIQLNNKGTSRDDDHHTFNRPTNVLDRFQTGSREGQFLLIAPCLCIRHLAYDDNSVRVVIFLDEVFVGFFLIDDLGGLIDGGFNGLEDGGTGSEVVAAKSLPFNCPATTLGVQVVGMGSRHKGLLCFLGEGQKRLSTGFAILQQYK